MEIKPQLNFLTDEFYETFKECKEILAKKSRPYSTAIFEVDQLVFAIPFRTNINHKYSYIFKTSDHALKSGLDFTKAVIISKDLIGDVAFINPEEYAEFLENRHSIAKDFQRFVKNYKKWMKKPIEHRPIAVMKYCTLKYFHKELRIFEQ